MLTLAAAITLAAATITQQDNVPALLVLSQLQNNYSDEPTSERVTLTISQGTRRSTAYYAVHLDPGTDRDMRDAALLLSLDALRVYAADGTLAVTRSGSDGLAFTRPYKRELTPDVLDDSLPPLCVPQLALAQHHIDPAHWDLTPHTTNITWEEVATEFAKDRYRIKGTCTDGRIAIETSRRGRLARLHAEYGEPKTTLTLDITPETARRVRDHAPAHNLLPVESLHELVERGPRIEQNRPFPDLLLINAEGNPYQIPRERERPLLILMLRLPEDARPFLADISRTLHDAFNDNTNADLLPIFITRSPDDPRFRAAQITDELGAPRTPLAVTWSASAQGTINRVDPDANAIALIVDTNGQVANAIDLNEQPDELQRRLP